MVIESIPKAVGMGFAVVVSLLVVVLLLRGKFNRRIGLVLLVAATLMGFLVFAPMLPNQFQVLLLGKTKQLGVPVPLAGAVLFLFVAMSFVLGRSFCGYACPIGAVQELVFVLPGKKLRLNNKKITLVFRLASLAAFLVLALGFSLGMLNYLGRPRFLLPGLHGVLLGVPGDGNSGRVPLPAVLPTALPVWHDTVPGGDQRHVQAAAERRVQRVRRMRGGLSHERGWGNGPQAGMLPVPPVRGSLQEEGHQLWQVRSGDLT